MSFIRVALNTISKVILSQQFHETLYKDDNSLLLEKVHQVIIREVYYLKIESSILAHLKFKGSEEQSIKHPQLANFTESKTSYLF